MPAKRHVSLRIAQDDLERIDQLAKERRLDRTTYLIIAGRQELDDLNVDQRLDDLEARVGRLEVNEGWG